MKLLFVADGRSPIALNWIRHCVHLGHEVHLASTYPCQPEFPLASLAIIPAAFGEIAGERKDEQPGGSAARRRAALRRLIPVGARTWLRQFAGPLTLPRAARRLREVVAALKPDIVHAMRIPFEGMLAAQALRSPAPALLVSVWGNDFTLHAPSNPWMGWLTRQALQRADGLHTDCARDQKLARRWGFAAGKPGIVLPGNGGIDTALFAPAPLEDRLPLILNPRGIRSYVRNDTFFQAIPLVLAQQSEARFLCVGMAGEAQALRWVDQLQIAAAVDLLPRQAPAQMADLFRRAQVVVSLTEHDGTPNTLLEALACGCYPVAGDIEALREWITPGRNGRLTPPGDPPALAEALLAALQSPAQRLSAAQENRRLIEQRAELRVCMAQAEAFYRSLRYN